MRTFILLIALSCAPWVAQAATWTSFFASPEFEAEFDKDSIQPINNLFVANFRFSYGTAKVNKENGASYLSAVVTSRFDCAGRRFAPYQRLEFSGQKGKLIRAAREIKPNSIITLQTAVDQAEIGVQTVQSKI